MPRSSRITFPGSIHHVYGRGINKHQIFFTDDDYQRFLEKLQQLVGETDIAISCWCLLPNHFHFLLRVNKVPLFMFMKRLLTSYAIFHNKKYDRIGSLFNDRYGSRLVQDDPYFFHVSRYIHLNPVLAGLTHHPRKYRFSSMAELTGESKWQIVDQKEVKRLVGEGEDSLDKYEQFVLDGLKVDISEWNPFRDTKEVIGTPTFVTHRIGKHVRQRKKN